MTDKYITVKVSDETSKVIERLLRVNSVENIFDFHLWIAGGFARIIGKIDEQSLNPKKTIYEYFRSLNGDIDIFGKNINDITSLINTNANQYDWNYKSPFAINCNSKNHYDDDFKEVHVITKIQFVTEFMYNSFDKCLDNFDFTNCKYALFKDNGNYYLRKDKRAPGFNSKLVLNIDECVSPLLGQRIIKYCRRHGFKGLTKTKETRNSFNTYLLKIISSSWDDIFNRLGNLDEISDYYIRRIHKQKPLSDKELSLFIGKFDTFLTEKIKHSYGFYLKEIGVTDWASNEIRKK